jgi:hypothetical protein
MAACAISLFFRGGIRSFLQLNVAETVNLNDTQPKNCISRLRDSTRSTLQNDPETLQKIQFVVDCIFMTISLSHILRT